MKLFYIVLAYILLTGCNSSDRLDQSKFSWEEKGHTPLSDIKSGIPVYDKSTVDYKRGDKSILKIKLADPVVISVADKPEKWGHFQFPVLYKSLDNDLVAQWNMSADAISSYGKGGHSYSVSGDNGKTWSPAQKESVPGGGLILQNGDRIRIHTPEALNVKDLQLPQPVDSENKANAKGYTYYKVSELPSELQGVYINRLINGEKTWRVEHSVLDDPQAVRYVRSGLFPVVWWGDMHIAADRSIYAGVYPVFVLKENGEVDPSGVSFYKSQDDGRTWKLNSRIPYSPDLKSDPNGDKRFGFGWTEPAFEILRDGSFLCVMRTSDGLGISPMYYSRSADLGKSWSRPVAFTRNGVLPRLLQLDNGVVVLVSGRPGVQLRFSIDGKGEHWTDPFEMLPFNDLKDQVSCGYTEIIPTGRDRFMIIYSDFKFKNLKGEERKAIKVREVQVGIK